MTKNKTRVFDDAAIRALARAGATARIQEIRVKLEELPKELEELEAFLAEGMEAKATAPVISQLQPNQPLETARHYGASQVADLLRVGTSKVYQLVREGKIRAVKIGGAIRISHEVVEQYIASLPTVEPKTPTHHHD